jgi:peptide-methionine (S)-S-oxide reductase
MEDQHHNKKQHENRHARATQIAVFGGGCFWCTETLFARLKGVVSATPGYSGGTVPNPTYEQVCGGKTGHAEAAQIEFDPSVISYEDLLTIFFFTHDPTTMNRQGNDVGTQYRSIIFYTNEGQKAEADRFIQTLHENGAYDKPIVTQVEPLVVFYPAEDYHKNYYETHKDQPYCELVIGPKIEKLEKRYGSLLQDLNSQGAKY